ncbi:MAG: phosphoribosyltransferase family protein [bacterium]|nr:phosphoribosyltransferase family protein [bacterium]MCY3580619.1 phosphoribosyltransferase family protein [bacterium]MCY3652155.1 phosphoribosyltransferase family protein [bacterium]MDE0643400.1 phosphoribosyltransferase family protein [bacterium]
MIATEVITPKSLAERNIELAKQIAEDYRSLRPVLVCVMSGSLPFLADLTRQMKIECETDFIKLTKYGEGSEVRLTMDTATNLHRRHVLIVKGIVDTGFTTRLLQSMLGERNCASLRTVTLLDRANSRILDVPIEYRGFEVGEEFLVGYGLDWNGTLRNLPSIWAILDMAGFASDPHAITNPMDSD